MTRRVGVERMVLTESLLTDPLGLVVPNATVVKLLRRELAKERARVRRIVNSKAVRVKFNLKPLGEWLDKKALLAALGRKGTRG